MSDAPTPTPAAAPPAAAPPVAAPASAASASAAPAAARPAAADKQTADTEATQNKEKSAVAKPSTGDIDATEKAKSKNPKYVERNDGVYAVHESGIEVLIRPAPFQPNLTGYVCTDPNDRFAGSSAKKEIGVKSPVKLPPQPRLRSTKRPYVPSARPTGKPFGYPSVNISDEQILDAMPENASSIFHVVDRRINFDAHAADASFYSLLRSWVQDDPYRKVPPVGTNLLEYVDLPFARRVVNEGPVSDTQSLGKRKAAEVASTDEEDNMEKSDTFGNIMKDHGRLMTLNRKSLSDRAKAVKRRKLQERKKQDAVTMERLKSLGIILPNM